MVTELLKSAEDEAVSAVKDAFAEGYKGGRVDGAAEWLPRYKAVQERVLEAERRPTMKDVVFAAVVSFFAGAITAGAVAWGTR